MIQRRDFLYTLVKAGVVLPFFRPFSSNRLWHENISDETEKSLTPEQTVPEKPGAVIPTKTITLYNTHTGECLKKCTFHENGVFIPESLAMINQLFRDHRTGKAHVIDQQLLLLLHNLTQKLGVEKTIHLVSGYRSKETNTCLHENSSGVAKNSLHCVGKAADIFIEGINHKNIQRAALALRAGGVGRYANFVHVDTGRVRRWGLAAA